MAHSKEPLVSIVMPSLNQSEYIGAAIDSVLSQNYSNLELIIFDGQSSDGTLEKLTEISSNDPRIRVFSEADSGPADAISKALKKARGEIIGWLNSDDLYAPNAIRRSLEAFDATPETILFYGHGQHIDGEGNDLGLYPTKEPAAGLSGFYGGCFICQPTVFFKAPMLTLLGKLDTSLKTSFDFDYWMRAFAAFQDRIGFLDAVQAKSRLHEDCITTRMRKTVALEGLALCKKHLGDAQIHWAVSYLEELRETLGCREDAEAFKEEAREFLLEASRYLNAQQIAQLSDAF